MPEDTQSSTTKKNTTMHTCACGEQHEEIPGSPSHRDTCTSDLKFGDSCCCGSGEAGEAAHKRCGHGPRCH